MFHDASVSRFAILAEEIHIETEEFSLSHTETMPPARIIIAGLGCIYRNDMEIAAFEIESDDAEIYGLDSLPEGVRLHLVWQFWKPRAPEVSCIYWFPGGVRHVQALSDAPNPPVRTPSTQS